MIALEGTSGIPNRSDCMKDKHFWLPQATAGLEEGCGDGDMGRPSVHWCHGRVLCNTG